MKLPLPRCRRPGPWLALIGLALGGCGGISAAKQNTGQQLTVYSSLPLQGASQAVSQAIVNGEKLALSEAGGRVGAFKLSYVSMDDSNPKTGLWDPGMTSQDAKTAAQDRTAIAYLGDYDSGASAISLPLVNAAGILQVSPASPYVGLTSPQDAGQDEPDRFYPTGKPTFGRLLPSDRVQGQAQADLMRGLGVRRLYVLSDTSPFDGSLASIVTADAQHNGVRLVSADSIDTAATDFSAEAAKIASSGADAVFFAGGSGPGVVKLWQQIYAADPAIRLLASGATEDPAFTAQIGPAGRNTFFTTPTLARRLYPPAAQSFFRLYRERFGLAPLSQSLYGYEAMQVALLAVRGAGAHGNERPAVIRQYFAIRNRDSVLGRYSVQPNGDTTLSDYGIDRVAHGRPTFDRALHVTPVS